MSRAERASFGAEGYVILALDGLQPDKGHEVLWVLRECVSGEVLLAPRSLLGADEKEIASLLEEVVTALEVPIWGVVSDGQHSIRNALKSVLAKVPHQLCQFHYLREAARTVFEADRHAKKELKKRLLGVRPIERKLQGREDEESEAIRGYCLAVRSAITDELGRPPLSASGLKLHERLKAIHASIERVGQKRGVPKELARLNKLLSRGLSKTAPLWPQIRTAYSSWVHRAAHILSNEEDSQLEEVRRTYRALLAEMLPFGREAGDALLASSAVSQFFKVTKSYWKGLEGAVLVLQGGRSAAHQQRPP